MAKDLDDVIRQMTQRGCEPPANTNLQLAFTRIVRFRPVGQKKAKKNAKRAAKRAAKKK